MKNTTIIFTLLFICTLSKVSSQSGSIGIGTLTPDASAVLDIQSAEKGLLIPRMTNAQIGTIANPAIGLQVFSLSDSCVHIYNGSNWLIDCALELDPKVGENTLNYLPKWDGTSLVKSTSVYEDASGNVGIGSTTPEKKLDVSGTIQANGFKMPTDATLNSILKSDASGNASWQPLVGPAYFPDINPMLSSGLTVGGNPSSIAVQNNFAYIVDTGSDDIKIINISDPTTPLLEGSLAIGGHPNSVAVQGSFVYVVDESSNDLKIIDISDSVNPMLTGSLSIGPIPVSIVVQGNYAYIVDKSSNDLKIIDVLDPANPVLSGTIIIGSDPKSVAIQGDFAYILDDNSNMFKIFNVSNPSSPIQVGSHAVGNDPRSVVIQGSFVYIQGQGNLGVYNVSDPANIIFTDYIGTGGGTVYSVIQDNYVYAINSSTNQLRIIDVSDPTNLTTNQVYSIGNNPTSIAVQGNYIYIVDESSNDLKIIDNGLYFPEAVGYLNGELVIYPENDGDPTNELQDWSNLPGIPAGFSDGVDNVNDADFDSANELITTAVLNGTDLEISDAGGTKMIDLSSLLDNTDSQDLSSTVNGNDRTISITGGTSTTLNVADADSDSLNEVITTAVLNGTDLEITDAGGTKMIDLGSLLDNTDSQDLSSTVNGNDRTISITGGTSTTLNVADADSDPLNEVITTAVLNGTDIEITDAGGTKIIDLSSLAGIDSTTVSDSDDIDLILTENTISAEIKLNNNPLNILDSDIEGLSAIEMDPQVGINTNNYLPKWSGSSLNSSQSLFENEKGYVGIGTETPKGILDVVVPYTLESVEQNDFTEWVLSSEIWQSFNTIESGILTSVKVNTGVVGPVTISIYGQIGVFIPQTLIYSETVDTSPFSNSFDSSYEFATGISLFPGFNYTLRIETANEGWFGASMNDPYSSGISNLGSSFDYQFELVWQKELDTPIEAISISHTGGVGIGRIATANSLEVEGIASKTNAGEWTGNSDKRLKKNIHELESEEMLRQLLSLQGVTYEWNDNKTGAKRPKGVQFGFIAQNIQEVFPSLVSEDKLGYLQTAYGTYDAMTVEAIRALYIKIVDLESEKEYLNSEVAALQNEISEMKQLKQRLAKLETILLVNDSLNSTTSEE